MLLALPAPIPQAPYSALCNLGLGSALALFLYPIPLRESEREQRSCGAPERGITAGLFLYARPARARRFFAIAAGLPAFPNTPLASSSSAITSRCGACCFTDSSWFVGLFAFAAWVSVPWSGGDHVDCCRKPHTRNTHREFINKNSDRQARSADGKWVSLIVKLGALVFIIFVPTQYAIYLQLLGRDLDHPDAALGVLGAYTAVQRLGAARRLGPRESSSAADGCRGQLTPTYPLQLAAYTFPATPRSIRDPQPVLAIGPDPVMLRDQRASDTVRARPPHSDYYA